MRENLSTSPPSHNSANVANTSKTSKSTTFSERGVGQRAREVLDRDLRPRELAALYAVTAGIPSAVDEVLFELRKDRTGDTLGVIQHAGNAWLTRHFAELPPLVQQVLAIVQVTTSPPVIAQTLGVSTDQAIELLGAARASALLLDHDAVPQQLKAHYATHIGATKLADLWASLAWALASSGTLTLAAAITLAQNHVTSRQVAQLLLDTAERTAHNDPGQAALLLDAARSAGASVAEIALLRAEVAARTGDYAAALHFADAVTNLACTRSEGTTEDLASAIRISATVATSRGMVAHAADLYRWLGKKRAGADCPIGAVLLFAAGDKAGAQEFLAHPDEGIPTTYAQGLRLLAEGVGASMDGSGKRSIAMFARAVSMLSPSSVRRAMPDHAAALGTIAALNCGDLPTAHSLLEAALNESRPETGVTARLQLLQGWASMLTGDFQAAKDILIILRGELSSPRDKLFELSLRAGLARRADDSAELAACWADARPVLAACSADLFSLLPVGELWLAAAHLSNQADVAHLVEHAHHVLESLEFPVLWTATFQWYGVQAAIIGDDPQALIPHANRLGAAAKVSPYAAALAAAGKTWIRVLAREFDTRDVNASARMLAEVGHRWDGARLAAEAAFRSTDPSQATALLQLARALRLPEEATSSAVAAGKAGKTRSTRNGVLSSREAEIANLVVQGFPYREIGERLFIASKTVEHHVARIRQRIGAQDRTEMLGMLRAMGFPTRTSEQT